MSAHRFGLLAAAAFLFALALLVHPGAAHAAGTPGAGGDWSACWPDSSQSSGIRCATNGAVNCTFSGSYSAGTGASSCSYTTVSGAYSTCGFSSGSFNCFSYGQSVCYWAEQPPPAGDINYGPQTIVCYLTAPQGQLAILPTANGFGEQLLNTASASFTFTLTNTGGNYVTINNSGVHTHNSAFAIISNTCRNVMLSYGQSCTIGIAFTPTIAQDYSTTLEVDYLKYGYGTYTTALAGLSGTGVTQYSPPVVHFLQTQPFSFSNQQYGASSSAYGVVIQNDGYSPLTVSGITTSGPEYFITGGTCLGTQVAPRGGQCYAYVQFAPAAIGPRSGSLTVVSNASNSPNTFLLGGGGIAPTFAGQPIDDVNAGGPGGDGIAMQVVGSTNPAENAQSGGVTAQEDGVTLVKEQIIVTPPCPGDPDCPGDFFNQPYLPRIPPVPRDPPQDHCIGTNDIEQPGIGRTLLAQLSGTPQVAPSGSEFVLDPIHAGTGNKFQAEADYVGGGRFSLSSVRTYNSIPFNSSAMVTQSFGPGWFGNWDRSVAVIEGKARVTQGDGKSYSFSGSAATGWTADNSRGQLTESVDGSGAATGWQYTSGRGATETFNAVGRLTSVSLLSGAVFTAAYDGQSHLASVTDPMGRTVQYAYDQAGRVSSLVDPAGGRTTYSYDARGRLSSVSYPDGRTRQYRYEDPRFAWALTSIIDETGQTYASFTYDANGRCVSNVFAGGVGGGSIAFSQTSTDSTTTTPDSTTWTRSFSINSGKVQMTALTPSCTGCGSGGESYQYDSLGRIAAYTNRQGITATYTYNSRGLPASVTEGGIRTRAFTWDPILNLPTQIAGQLSTTSYTYDSQGRKLSETISGGGVSRTTSYTYDALGRLVRVTGPRTDVADTTDYGYDSAGHIATITNALGQVTRYTAYDPNGNALAISYPDGTTASFSYDPRGRLLSKTIAGQTTTYTYNAVGDLSTETDPAGVVTTYDYDAAHRLIGKDRLGEGIRYTLDNAGRTTKTEVFDSTGYLVSTSSVIYDGVGRVTQKIGANGQLTQIFYDANGNPTRTIDPDGYSTWTSYDSLNRPYLVTDQLGHTAQAAYDDNDKVTSIRDPNGSLTSYSSNGVGEELGVVSPDTGTTTLTRGSGGMILMKTDARGASQTFTYDPLGRLKQVTRSDGNGVSKTYDVGISGVGRLGQMLDASGSTAYAYDSFGRVAAMTQVASGVPEEVTYSRDAIGRPTAITYPSGKVLQLAYQDGQVVSVEFDGHSIASGVQYFPFSGPESWTFGTGAKYVRYIDADGRIARYLTPTGERRNTFDAAGHLIRVDDVVGGIVVESQSYTYDVMGRLSTFSGYTSSAGSESETFTYDANGNRASSTLDGVTRSYNYVSGTNRLASVTQGVAVVVTNTFDDAGNVVSSGGQTFSYDAAGRLVQAVSGSGTATYAYNGFGQRTVKTIGAQSERFVYDENGHLLGEYDASGAVIREYIWLSDTPIAVVTFAGDQYSVGYIWSDQLNTPRKITNSSNQILWTWDSLPFGETSPNDNPSGLGGFAFNLRLPGQYWDQETGLSQNWHRDYDAATGRYIESDPIGIRMFAGLNTYVYAENNPIEKSDAKGLFATCVIGGGEINIYIPITFVGAGLTADAENQFRSSVESAWSGNLNGVPFKVHVTDGPQNTVNFLPGAGRASVLNDIATCYQRNPGDWPHEAGHLMGLDDAYHQIGNYTYAFPGSEGSMMGDAGAVTAAERQLVFDEVCTSHQ